MINKRLIIININYWLLLNIDKRFPRMSKQWLMKNLGAELLLIQSFKIKFQFQFIQK